METKQQSPSHNKHWEQKIASESVKEKEEQCNNNNNIQQQQNMRKPM